MMPIRLLAACVALSLRAEGSRAVYHRMLSLSGARAPYGVRVGWTSGPGDILGNGSSTVEYGLSPDALTGVALTVRFLQCTRPSGAGLARVDR